MPAFVFKLPCCGDADRYRKQKGKSKSFLPPPGLPVSFQGPFLLASKRDRGDGEESSLQGPSLCITKLSLESGFKPLRQQLNKQHSWITKRSRQGLPYRREMGYALDELFRDGEHLSRMNAIFYFSIGLTVTRCLVYNQPPCCNLCSYTLLWVCYFSPREVLQNFSCG